MKYFLILGMILFSSVVNATELDPTKFGYVDPDNLPRYTETKRDLNFYCEYWMASTNTPGQNYFKCSDGSLRVAKENLWVKRTENDPEPLGDRQEFPADTRVNIPGQTLMTITAFVDDSYSYRAGKMTRRKDRPYRSISYLLVPSMEMCEKLAPTLAYQQFLMWANSGRKFKVEYFCD